MNLPAADQDFLRDLVKLARQRSRHVHWVDRDGSARITALTETEARRLGMLARDLGISQEAALREAAHLPAAKRPAPAG